MTLFPSLEMRRRVSLKPDKLRGVRMLPMASAVFIVALAGEVAAMPQTQQFSIESADGRARLNGQLDLAGNGGRIVILVSGTGFFDRNVKLGQSGTPADFVFRDLSERLNAGGVSTVRWDKRGVVCATEGEAACIDSAVVATTSAVSGAEDFSSVFAWTQRQYPKSCIAVLAHSEGMIHVARSIEVQGSSPAAIIGMGALMESPKDVFRWQRIERIPDSFREADLNGDGTTTNEELVEALPRTPAGVFGDPEGFRSPTGGYDAAQIEAMRTAWTQFYENEASEALAADRAAPFAPGGVTMGSYDWWQQWFNDAAPVARRINAFTGPIKLIYGALDSQTPSARQTEAVKADLASHGVRITVLDDLGHTLGRHVFLGPVDPAGAVTILEQVNEALDEACGSAAP